MTTYFVDPSAGNDSNAGTSTGAAWATLPGWGSTTTHGAFTSGNKIPVGSVIEIKAGTTLTGQRWIVNSTYFAQPANSGQRITVQVSSSWGSGNFVIDGTGATVPAFNGGIQIASMSYITITGADATRRFVWKNYTAPSGMLWYQGSGTEGNSTRDSFNELKWFEVHHCTGYGLDNYFNADYLYQDGLAHDCGAVEGQPAGKSSGIILGDTADGAGERGIIRRVRSYNNGLAATANDGSVSFGIQQTGGKSLRYEDCEWDHNGRDGSDNGRADNAGNSDITFVNNFSHDNGEDGFGLNSGPTGTVTAIHINTTSCRNGQANWTTYDGAHVELYNCLGFGGTMFHAFVSTPAFSPVPTIKTRNCYFRTSGLMFHYYQPTNGRPTIDTDYCLWVPNASNSQTFDDDASSTFASPITTGWTRGAHDHTGIAFAQAFINTATDDYHLADSTGTCNNTGLDLSNTPTGVNTDKDSVARSSPPDIGPYEFGPPATLPFSQTDFRNPSRYRTKTDDGMWVQNYTQLIPAGAGAPVTFRSIPFFMNG